MKLLLVDDDDTLATALQRGLRAEGFSVEVVRDGVEAIWRARAGGYDLILLDVMLPGCNGYRVCAEIRSGGDRTPILMLTAKDGPLDEAEGLDTGADDYVRKPFSFAVLVARIHALVRRAALGEPPPMRLGDLRVEPRHRRVLRGETEIPLTAREFDLLSYLVRRPGQVVSKAQLLAGIWEDDFEGDPNVVEVYVGRLRRKIDEPFSRHTVETVRGAGYRVVPS